MSEAIASPEQSENKHLMPILIDAVFRSHTAVPSAEALPLYDAYPDVAVALLIDRSDGSHSTPENSKELLQLLLRIETERNRPRWLAVASLLAGSVDFKRHLIDAVQFEYSVHVVDDGDYRPTMESGRPVLLGGIIGRAPAWAGWPSAPTYWLTDSPRTGATLLLADPFISNLYLWTSNEPYASTFPSAEWKRHQQDIVRHLYSHAFCAVCATGPRSFGYPNILGGQAEIRWRSPQQVEQLFIRTAENYVSECRRFMNALDEGLWSVEQVKSRVTIIVSDRRSNRTVPLPNPSGVVHIADY